MRLRCLLVAHKWFWEDVEIKFGSVPRVWNMLNLKVCTYCGKIKAVVEGKDDTGRFRTIDGHKTYEYKDKVKNW